MERQAKDGTVYRQVGQDEWEPVTRQAKDGTTYKKVGSDAWEPLEPPVRPQEAGDSANDLKVAAERATLFGARPFVAGVGGAIGGAIGQLEKDGGLIDKLQGLPGAMGKGFSTERQAAQGEEAELQARRPGLVAAADIGGAIATAPLLAAKGAVAAGGLLRGTGQAAKLGAGMGTAQALGHANSTGEAIETIGLGAITGAGAQAGLNAIGKAAPAVWRGAKQGAVKTASALTGVSEKEIMTYATRAGEVKKLINESGGDIAAAADKVREGVGRDIQVTRQRLGSQIGAALDDPKYANTAIDAAPVLQKLDEAIGKIGDVTARFRPDEINELKNLRDLVAQSLDDSGRISPRTLSDIKEELQAIAKPSYNNGALIFPKGDLAAKASKGAAAEARRLLNNAVPEVKNANEQLRRLHLIEEGMNRNLIRVGKSESALLAAGSGSNPRNAKYLSSLDEITGGSASRQAENLAAARSFNNTQLLPVDTTGKAVARMMTGGGVGTLLGGPVGSVVGAAATSPAALKAGLDVARVAQRAGGAIARNTPVPPSGSARAALTGARVRTSSQAPAAIPRAAENQVPPELDGDSSTPSSYRTYPDGAQTKPLKGKDKWAQAGAEKVLAHVKDPDLKAKLKGAKASLLKDSKARDLLAQASDLKPGSKAMDRLTAQLKKRLG